MEAEDKRLNFRRQNLQAVFQSNHCLGFTPAAQLYCLNSTLPSLQQCLQRWEAPALEATHVTPSPCPAMILWPGLNESSLETGGPHQPPPLPACWQRGLQGQSLLPPDPQGRAAAHGDKDPVLPRAWSQSLCVGTPMEPQGLRALYCSQKFRNSLQQARQELPTPQKWGSMIEFIAQSTL